MQDLPRVEPDVGVGLTTSETFEATKTNLRTQENPANTTQTNINPADVTAVVDDASKGLTDEITATEALQLVAMRSARSLVAERARVINKATKGIKGEAIKPIRGELAQQMKVAVAKAENVDKTIARLQTDSEVSKRALGFDMESAILKQELQDLQEMEQEGGNKTLIEERRKEINERLTKIGEERIQLRDPQRKEIPDVLTDKALETAKRLKGEDLTAEEQQEIKDNPLGFLEKKIVEAAFSDNPSDMKKLTAALGLTVEQAEVFEEALKISNELKESSKLEKYGKKVMKGTAMVGLFGLLMAWLASKDKRGGGQMMMH